jgi:hypothetical protein
MVGLSTRRLKQQEFTGNQFIWLKIDDFYAENIDIEMEQKLFRINQITSDSITHVIPHEIPRFEKRVFY